MRPFIQTGRAENNGRSAHMSATNPGRSVHFAWTEARGRPPVNDERSTVVRQRRQTAAICRRSAPIDEKPPRTQPGAGEGRPGRSGRALRGRWRAARHLFAGRPRSRSSQPVMDTPRSAVVRAVSAGSGVRGTQRRDRRCSTTTPTSCGGRPTTSRGGGSHASPMRRRDRADRLAFEAAVAAGRPSRPPPWPRVCPCPPAFRHIRHHGRLRSRVGAAPVCRRAVDRGRYVRRRLRRRPDGRIEVAYLESSGHLLVRKGRQVGVRRPRQRSRSHVARERPGRPAARSSARRCASRPRSRRGLASGSGRSATSSSRTPSSLLRLAKRRRGSCRCPAARVGSGATAAALVVIDEASWVDDADVHGRPGAGRRDPWPAGLQSTPGAPVGSFHDLATSTRRTGRAIVVRQRRGADDRARVPRA